MPTDTQVPETTPSPASEEYTKEYIQNLIAKLKHLEQMVKTQKSVELEQQIQRLAQRVKLILLLDASGSMLSRVSDVIGGVNTYLGILRGDGIRYDVSLYLFNDKLTPVFTDKPLYSVPKLTEKEYITSGSTALYDSLACVLASTQEQWGTPEHPYGALPVFCIIDTDGHENSSLHTTKEMIMMLIKKHEAAGNWTFVYMGADQDAWSLASHIGLAQGNVVSYSGGQTKGMYQRLATATSTASGTASAGGPIQTRTFFTPTPTPSGTNSHISSSILIDTSDKN